MLKLQLFHLSFSDPLPMCNLGLHITPENAVSTVSNNVPVHINWSLPPTIENLTSSKCVLLNISQTEKPEAKYPFDHLPKVLQSFALRNVCFSQVRRKVVCTNSTRNQLTVYNFYLG